MKGEMGEREKSEVLRAKRAKSIDEVLEEVLVLIDIHFFTEFLGTKSSVILKRLIDKQSLIDTRPIKRTWKTMNRTP